MAERAARFAYRRCTSSRSNPPPVDAPPILSGSVRLLALFLQIGIAYGWLIFALYIFEPTREYTGRLTEIVLTPLSGFMSKVGSSLPVLVIATASIAALVVLVRFVGAFFDSAARGETAIGWVPPDLVSATSLVVRFAIVVLFLVVAVPFITGSEDAALSRIGLVAVLALGLGSTPMLASMCVGLFVVYGRGLSVGEFASFGPYAGRIDSITLLDVRLRDAQGCEVRIPHLLSLFYPTRVLGKIRPVSATMTVSSAAAQPAVRQLLAGVASTVGAEPELEIRSIRREGNLCTASPCAPISSKPSSASTSPCRTRSRHNRFHSEPVASYSIRTSTPAPTPQFRAGPLATSWNNSHVLKSTERAS